MGCGASTAPKRDEFGKPYDPVTAAAGTWIDPTGKEAYDKVIVKLVDEESGNGDSDDELAKMSIVAEIVGGGCGKASKCHFSHNNSTRVNLLMHKRTAGKTQVSITWGSDEGSATTDIPDASAGWVEHKALIAGRWTVALKAEAWEIKLETAEALEACGMSTHTIEIDNGELGERATLTYKTTAANTKIIYWLPGRNDMFSRPHVVAPLLAAGFDLFALEHRRLGRSQIGCTAEDGRLFSHCCDFRRYLHEFDKGLAFAFAQKEYSSVVLYAHSTGCLEASLFLREGAQRERIGACVLNSPFLDWGGMSSSQELALDSADEVFPILKLLKGKEEAERFFLSEPTEPGRYLSTIWSQYSAIDLRCRGLFNTVTAGWAQASSQMHEELRNMTPLDIPLLLLHTDGDVVLDFEEMPKLAARISKRVENKFFPNCRHDMLLNYTVEDNEKVLQHMLAFLAKIA